MGARMVFWLLLGLMAWLWWRAKRVGRPQSPAPERRKPDDQSVMSSKMVSCAHCGVHVPESESVSLEGRSYCSALHRDQGPRL